MALTVSDLVVIESPYGKRVDGSPASPEEIADNMKYLQACIKDSINRGEAPFASHQMYTGALDDTLWNEREAGIAAGLKWGQCAPRVVVYVDRGITPGMIQGVRAAGAQGKVVTLRSMWVDLGPVRDG